VTKHPVSLSIFVRPSQVSILELLRWNLFTTPVIPVPSVMSIITIGIYMLFNNTSGGGML
jgi:hypothetical protein